MTNTRWVLAAMLTATLAASAAGPSFRPDSQFTGSSLKGWRSFGNAKWTADQGTITGAPGAGGGWLVLDDSFQDISFFTEFRCETGCETGVLLRAEKTPDGGMKGVFVSFDESELKTYSVTIDAKGAITQREPLPPGGGLVRVAPPPPPDGQRRAFPRPPAPRADLPLKAPDTSLKKGEWNFAEVFFDTNTVRSFLNNGRQSGATVDDGGYGPIALFAGGSAPVHFRGPAHMDMSLKVRDEEKVSTDFRKQRLNDFYFSWGTAAADFNKDGVLDLVAGPYVYFGPDYKKSREIFYALGSNPVTEFSSPQMEYAADFTGDGWPDVITISYGGPGPNIYLYENPKGERRRWNKYGVLNGVQSEIARVVDLDGDGKPEVVYSGEGHVRFAKPDPANPTGTWKTHDISEQGLGWSHGIGVGDVNRDGKLDVVNPYGWWEQPASGADSGPWRYHPAAFGRYDRGMMGGSVMAVYDVNNDGLNDVVTSLNAHGWGLSWFEQKRGADGETTWVEHKAMGDLNDKNAGGVAFSELHGTGVADVDGDGVPDFIAGKRYFSHLDTNLDPFPRGEPDLYWYKTVRNKNAPGGAELVPHLIDTHSGVGSDLLATDLNNDGAVDIAVSTRFGTFIYWGVPKGHSAKGAK